MITLHFDWPMLLSLLAGVILPLLVGLVTTRDTNKDRKAILLAALSVITPMVAELGNALATNTPYDLGMALMTALGTFLIGVGLHYGLWKPTGVSVRAQEAFTPPKPQA